MATKVDGPLDCITVGEATYNPSRMDDEALLTRFAMAAARDRGVRSDWDHEHNALRTHVIARGLWNRVKVG